MFDRRKKLSPQERDEAGRIIQHAFVESALFARAQAIALYSPIHNEVDTSLVMRAAMTLGKMVLFPIAAGGRVIFRSVSVPGDLKPGAYGIPEPAASGPQVDPAAVDIIVIPGIAFDLTGHRVGYGKGYYDKTLHPLEGRGRFCGFCYDFQLVDEFHGEPHDVRMDWIITEKRIIRAAGLHR